MPFRTTTRLPFVSAARFASFASLALMGVALLPAQTASPVTPPPSYGSFTQSYTLPFVRPMDRAHLDKTLHVRAQLNGGVVGEYTVDTGSVGIVVAAEDIPSDKLVGIPGELTYSSSGYRLTGVWTTVTVTFPDAKGPGGVATAVVPVLAVNKSVCIGTGVNAANCKPSDHPHTHMMGIGFGRGQESHPEKNPFLNLKEMQAGTMRRGYAITAEGVTLGLTDKVAGPGYVWQKLTEKKVSVEAAKAQPGIKDWETAAGSFKVEDQQAGAGTVLMDTGLTNMILASDGSEKGDVPDGKMVTIDLLGGQLHYSFKVGDGSNPQTPRRVSWVKPTHGIFVNTGLRALADFDYLFDSDGGYLALRPVKP